MSQDSSKIKSQHNKITSRKQSTEVDGFEDFALFSKPTVEKRQKPYQKIEKHSKNKATPSQNKHTKPAAQPASKPHYHGHRERLRERFLAHDPSLLPDYELLELILFRSLPRKDTKPIAKALINHFGTFAEVLSADIKRLKEIEGIKDASALDLKIIFETSARISKSRIEKKEVLSSFEKVIDYCRTRMAFEQKEQFRILFLDKRNTLIADEMQQQGTIDHTPVYPREVIKRALELGATAFILVHNHPSGDPTPSRADIQMTQKIIQCAEPLEIAVHDHLIIGKNGHASFRHLELL